MPPPSQTFNGNVAWGQVKAEKTFDNSTTVSEVIYPVFSYPPNPQANLQRTERRADGSTRAFQYSYDDGPELASYTDFDPAQPHTSIIDYQAGISNDDYFKVFTDARTNVTSINKEIIAGAVRSVKRGNRPASMYWYTDDQNPYYLDHKTDERGKTTQYTRYTDGPNKNMIQFINYPDGGSEGFTYNNFGQVLTHLMTSGGTEEFTYERGLKRTYTPPWTASDPSRHQTVYTY